MPRLFGEACLWGDRSGAAPWRIDRLGEDHPYLAPRPLPTLATRDSARLAARLARLADALPMDSSVADFRGLPVVVRDAWVLVLAPEDTTVIAIVSRRLPIESAPLEEQLLIVADPDTAARGALRARWYARSSGPEERLETRDLLSALRDPTGTPLLLLVRESVDRAVVDVLARDADRVWRLRAEDALPPCP